MIDQIRKAVSIAFGQAGDMVESVSYKKQDERPDNPPPGYEDTYTFYDVRIIRMDYTPTEMNLSGGTIDMGDQKVLLPKDEVDFRPAVSQDSLIIDGSEHSIKSAREKSKALFILRI